MSYKDAINHVRLSHRQKTLNYFLAFLVVIVTTSAVVLPTPGGADAYAGYLFAVLLVFDANRPWGGW